MMYIVIYVTAKNMREAKKIAKALLDKRLIACANLVKDVASLYRWEGKVCQDNEVLMILKTKKGLFKKVEQAVVSLHSYDTPEVIALPLIAGSARYFNWIKSSVR